MSKFSESELSTFTRPPSDSEESKLSNSERMVKDAIREDPDLSKRSISVFGQGSYANDTNVRLNSDIDINVRLNDVFYYDLPKGKTDADFGLGPNSDYRFSTFKDSVQSALVNKFGSSVDRRDKCIFVEGNSYRVDTDVVPTFSYRRYAASGGYNEGVKFKSDSGELIQNFPLQHIDNGKGKNSQTSKRFKRLTRIYRRVRYNMIDENLIAGDKITSFLMECLVWNVPNPIFNDYNTWTDRLKNSIVYLHEQTKNKEKCGNWGEVSELLYLFHQGRKWNHEDVNDYLQKMWVYLEY